MRNNTRGFTLVELMVTVTIIAIVSAVAISPFSLLSKGMETKEMGDHIGEMIASLDESIEKSQVSSYMVVFESGSIGFVTDQDWYRQKNRVSLDFDFASHSGVLQKVNAFTGVFVYDILKQKHIIHESSITDSETTKSFSFTQNQWGTEYEVRNTLDNTPIKSFLIRYYDLPGATDIAENPTRLVSITSQTGSEYTALTMQNINGKRTLVGSGATLDKLTGAKLVFEKNGTELVTIIGEMGQ